MLDRVLAGIREDESGFTIVEVMLVLFVLSLLIGMGIWIMYGAGSKTGARTAQSQIAQDLRLCAKKAETSKDTWGILFYGKTHDANENKYIWFTGDKAFCDPPLGAVDATGGGQLVQLQDGAKIFGGSPPWVGSGDADYLYVRFIPVGSSLNVEFYISGSPWAWQEIEAIAGDPGHLQINVSDNKGDAEENVKIYKLGYVGFQ